MIPLLYPLSFLAAVISLSLWFYFQKNRGLSLLLRAVFFTALAVYLVSVVLHAGAWSAKWSLLFRDLAIMAVAPSLLSILRNRSWLFFAMLGAGILSMIFGWNRFSQKLTASVPEGEWELLLELKEGSELDRLNELTKQYGLHYERAFFPGKPSNTDLDDFYLVEIPQAKEDQMAAISAAFLKNAAVDDVEKNDLVQVAPITELPARKNPSKEYGINDPGIQYLWGFDQMNVAGLYSLYRETKAKPVKKPLIAILDTGVDGTHEDLKANFRSTNGKYNKDKVGHGTHCAGIAASVSNNSLGIASFSPGAGFLTVTSIKVLNDYGAGTQAGIIKGMIEAADLGADVISMSLGGRSDDSKQNAYQKAVEYANKAGAIVVVATVALILIVSEIADDGKPSKGSSSQPDWTNNYYYNPLDWIDFSVNTAIIIGSTTAPPPQAHPTIPEDGLLKWHTLFPDEAVQGIVKVRGKSNFMQKILVEVPVNGAYHKFVFENRQPAR